MFSLSPESIANHIGERRPRNQLNQDGEEEEGSITQANPQQDPVIPTLSQQPSLDEPYSVV